MATYEYVCLACERHFEQRRPIGEGSVTTALGCPSCGSDRVRRRFSFAASTGAVGAGGAGAAAGCGCGACTCGAS